MLKLVISSKIGIIFFISLSDVASGGAYDFFFKYFDEGIYSYTYELRPATAAEGGFVLPAEQIEPAAKETIASLKAFSTENFNC